MSVSLDATLAANEELTLSILVCNAELDALSSVSVAKSVSKAPIDAANDELTASNSVCVALSSVIAVILEAREPDAVSKLL